MISHYYYEILTHIIQYTKEHKEHIFNPSEAIS